MGRIGNFFRKIGRGISKVGHGISNYVIRPAAKILGHPIATAILTKTLGPKGLAISGAAKAVNGVYSLIDKKKEEKPSVENVVPS
jgi:hypothetical protein